MSDSDRNYYSAFISVSEDCPSSEGTEPPQGAKKPTEAELHYLLTREECYFHTQEQILFRAHLLMKGLDVEAHEEGGEKWEEFFAEEQPCLLESPLAQRFGWGFHFNADGLVAAWPVESAKYHLLAENPELMQMKAFSNS